MAITRTPWIDDDGTGTTGTVINNAEKQLLYDQIDAAIAAAQGWTNLLVNSNGGTVNDWNPGIVGHTIINVSLASGTTLNVTGLAAATPVIGQIVRFILTTTSGGQIVFHHEHTASVVTNRMHLRQTPTQAVNGYWGYAELQYVNTYLGPSWVLNAIANGVPV